jgi:hemoglobin
VTEICPPKAAEHFLERARRIAESLEMGIAVGHGALLAKGERYRRTGPAEIAEPPR